MQVPAAAAAAVCVVVTVASCAACVPPAHQLVSGVDSKGVSPAPAGWEHAPAAIFLNPTLPPCARAAQSDAVDAGHPFKEEDGVPAEPKVLEPSPVCTPQPSAVLDLGASERFHSALSHGSWADTSTPEHALTSACGTTQSGNADPPHQQRPPSCPPPSPHMSTSLVGVRRQHPGPWPLLPHRAKPLGSTNAGRAPPQAGAVPVSYLMTTGYRLQVVDRCQGLHRVAQVLGLLGVDHHHEMHTPGQSSGQRAD
jgi:hypothetical protein